MAFRAISLLVPVNARALHAHAIAASHMGRHREQYRPKLRPRRLEPVLVPVPEATPRTRLSISDEVSVKLAKASLKGFSELDQEATKILSQVASDKNHTK